MREHDLAQLNIGRLSAPTDSPIVAEFMEALDAVNALAEDSPGFVWCFQTEEANATAERPFDDETILVNLSTWSSVDALSDYVYRTVHAEYLRRRREWFERLDDVGIVLWWVPAGHRPSVDEAIRTAGTSRAARPDCVRLHVPSSFRLATAGRMILGPASGAWACGGCSSSTE